MCHKLLIIDDDPISHCILNKLVEFNNLTAHHSNYMDARKALLDLKAEGVELPDAILLDINMPGMNGWQFLDQMKHAGTRLNHIPVYIVSSSVDPGDKIQSEQYKAVKGFLVKPISAAELKKALNK